MDLEDVSRHWNRLGAEDPLWAVLTSPGKSGNRWSTAEFLETGVHEVNDVLDDLRERSIAVQMGSALDFGCGAGRLTQALGGAGFAHVVGIDVSRGMLDTARKLNQYQEQCSYVHNDQPDLSVIDDNSMDLVYSSRVLQHLPPRLAHIYIAEFFRIARPGGIVVFQIPSHPTRTPAGVALRLVPDLLLNRLRKGMQMHGTRESSVASIVLAANGAVLAVEPDQAAGARWISRRYLCRSGDPVSLRQGG